MFSHFLRSFVGSLRAHKLLTLISVASLAIGLTVFAMSWLYVKRELSYDRGWPEAERVLRLTLEQSGMPGSPDGTFNSVNARAWPVLMNYFGSQIEHATRVSSTSLQAVVGEGEHLMQSITYADPTFLEIFRPELLSGDLEQVFAEPGFIALSERAAEALGGLQVGDPLDFHDLLLTPGAEQAFTIGAIYRVPAPSSQNFNALIPIPDAPSPLFGPRDGTRFMPVPWETGVQVWLTLKRGVSLEDFNAQQPAFVQTQVTAFNESLPPGARISDHLFYRFQPLTEIHLNPVGFEVAAGAGDKAKLLTFAAVGVLVLLVGCSNAASLSLAMVLNRRKEIGIRKACGAGKGDTLRQHLSEALLLALLAGGLALALQAVLLPGVISLLSISGEFGLTALDYVVLLGMAAAVGLLNALYPALVLSGVRPQQVLRPGLATDAPGAARGSLRARGLLVGAQFSLALAFMAGAATLYVQLAVISKQPLGFDSANLLAVTYNTTAAPNQGEVLRERVSTLPGVETVAISNQLPNQDAPPTMNSIRLVHKGEVETQVQATSQWASADFFELLDIPLLAGRHLDPQRDASAALASRTADGQVEAVMLNRRAAQGLGFVRPEQAVDQLIYQRGSDNTGRLHEFVQRVVGVVEDSMYASVRRRPLPERYVLPQSSFGNILLIKYQPGSEAELQQRVIETYQEIVNVSPLLFFAETRIHSAFIQERSDSRLLLSAAAIALFLSCVGLYGLASSTMVRSVKEVGVRKAIGASVAGLVGLFLWRFSRPVLLANLIAWPLAGWFVLRWIQRFPHQLDLAWLPPLFLGASLLVLLVAWVTVAGVTARAAMRAPVQSLRYE